MSRVLRSREFALLTDPHPSSSESQKSAGGSPGGDGPFRPLIFGEALFDYFPDGSRVLGGAPFNVAWHLRGFKADPLMITAVGGDQDGAEILEKMESWGMDRSGVQLHPTRPTGRVTAHLDGGQPRYDIEPRQAYDAVSREGLPPRQRFERASLLYHGSLGLREATSRATLEYLKEMMGVPVLVDVNLRYPWWDPQETPERIRGAEWVKMNHEEVGFLAGRPVDTPERLAGAGEELMAGLAVQNLIVTRGANGALAFTNGGVTRQAAPVVEDIVDTVGAGDAFSAVLALGIHGNWPIGLTLQRATEFAGALCRIRGAIPNGSELYRFHLQRWGHAK
jgi:fructokinase